MLDVLSSDDLAAFELQEFELMCSLDHKNVLKFYEKFDLKFLGSPYLCIIAEFCEVIFFFISFFLIF